MKRGIEIKIVKVATLDVARLNSSRLETIQRTANPFQEANHFSHQATSMRVTGIAEFIIGHAFARSVDSTHPTATRRANHLSSGFGVVKPFLQKYSDFQKTQISCISIWSCPPEGRLEIVTDAGQDAVDADGAEDEGA
jgi:hypothetical protein